MVKNLYILLLILFIVLIGASVLGHFDVMKYIPMDTAQPEKLSH